MKLSEIKKKVLNGKLPIKVGQTVSIPVYKITSRGHDPQYPGFKREWCVGKGKVRGIDIWKEGKTTFVRISFYPQPGAYQWVDDVFVNRFNVNEDLFSKKWVENYVKQLNNKYCSLNLLRKFNLGEK